MNWVGGSRSRIKLQNEKKLQKDFFERKRFLNKHQRPPKQPSRHQPGRQSQDLIALRAVSRAYSTLPHDDANGNHRLRAVRKLDLTKFNSSERFVDEVELPPSLSPGLTPSTIALNNVNHENSIFRKNSKMLNKPMNSESVFTPIQDRLPKDVSTKLTPLAPGRSTFVSLPGISNRIHQQLNPVRKVYQKQLARHSLPQLGTIREESQLGIRAPQNFNLNPFEEFQRTPMKQYYWSPDETPALAFPEEGNQIVPYSSENLTVLPEEELDIALPYTAGTKYADKPSPFLRNKVEFKIQNDTNDVCIKRGSRSVPFNAQSQVFKDENDFDKQISSMNSCFQGTPESHLITKHHSGNLPKPVPRSVKQICPRSLFPDTEAEDQRYDITGHIGKGKMYNLITPTNSIVWTTPTKRRKISPSLSKKLESCEGGLSNISYGRISPLKESPSLFFRHKYINSGIEPKTDNKISTSPTIRQSVACGQNDTENWNSEGIDCAKKENRIQREKRNNQLLESNNYRTSFDVNSLGICYIQATDQQTNNLSNSCVVSNLDQRRKTQKSPGSCMSEPGTTSFWKRQGPNASCDIKTADVRISEPRNVASEQSGASRVFQSEMSFLQTFDTLRGSAPHIQRHPKTDDKDMNEILSELDQLETQQSLEVSSPISERNKVRNPSEELIEEIYDADQRMIQTSQGTDDSFETACARSVHSQEVQPSPQADNTDKSMKPYSNLPCGIGGSPTTTTTTTTRYSNNPALIENVPSTPYGHKICNISRGNMPNALYSNCGSNIAVQNVLYSTSNSHTVTENVQNTAVRNNGSTISAANEQNTMYGSSPSQNSCCSNGRIYALADNVQGQNMVYSSIGTCTTGNLSRDVMDRETIKSSVECCSSISIQTQTDNLNREDSPTSACIGYCDMSTQWDPADFSGLVPSSLLYDKSGFKIAHSVCDSCTTPKLMRTDAVETSVPKVTQSGPEISPCAAIFQTTLSRKPDFAENHSTSVSAGNLLLSETYEQSRDCKIVLERVPLGNNNVNQGSNQCVSVDMLGDNLPGSYSLRPRHKKDGAF